MGLAGWSGSGKTTLLVELLPALRRRGLVVSTVKHAHHEFDIDRPGKDSFRHREAGAAEVLIASSRRWALMHENTGEDEPGLDALLARLQPVDLVIVEGFKRHAHPKIEIHRASVGKPLLAPEDPDIIAVATDNPGLAVPLPLLDLGNGQAIAAFIIERLGL